MLKALVFVVDDTPAVLEIARAFLQDTGEIECRTFSTAEDLLCAFQPGSVDCVVADLRLPGVDGDELLSQLVQLDPAVSYVVVTGYADVKTAVRLMEHGALTLLEKPFTGEELVGAVKRGIQRTKDLRSSQSTAIQTQARLATLTEDEREVMECMINGLPNKAIAQKLTVSSRTVDRRRRRVLDKMAVDSVAELATLTAKVGIAGITE